MGIRLVLRADSINDISLVSHNSHNIRTRYQKIPKVYTLPKICYRGGCWVVAPPAARNLMRPPYPPRLLRFPRFCYFSRISTPLFAPVARPLAPLLRAPVRPPDAPCSPVKCLRLPYGISPARSDQSAPARIPPILNTARFTPVNAP